MSISVPVPGVLGKAEAPSPLFPADAASRMFAFSTDNAAAKAFFRTALSANMANDRKLLVGGESLH